MPTDSKSGSSPKSVSVLEVAAELPTKEQVVDLLVHVVSDSTGAAGGKAAKAWADRQRELVNPEVAEAQAALERAIEDAQAERNSPVDA